jgi:hypothetical protein
VGAESTPACGKVPLTVDALMRLEEFGELALSPDARWLAYVVKRPRATAQFHHYPFLAGGDRGDVWLFDTADGTARNLTCGEADGAGYWAPSWSTDSARLSMLSTKGGNIHLWGCEVGRRSLSQISGRPVDYWDDHPHLWVSDRKVLVATLPEGERSERMAVEFQAAEVAMREWPKAWRGEEVTASALDSGAHPPFGERPQGDLRLVDAATGEEQTLMNGFFREMRVAPDGRHVACLQQVDVVRPEPGSKLPRGGSERHRLGLATVTGTVVSGGVEGVETPLSGSLRWSPDGTAIALIGRSEPAPGSPPRALRYRLAGGHVDALTGDGLDPTAVIWSVGGELLVLATAREEPAGRGPERADWWLVGAGCEPRNLSGELAVVPRRLVREKGRNAFVGLAGGDVMRLSLDHDRWVNLTEGLDARVASLVWPPVDVGDQESFGEIVVAVADGSSTEWCRIDLATGELS